jgi:hypothetical protein
MKMHTHQVVPLSTHTVKHPPFTHRRTHQCHPHLPLTQSTMLAPLTTHTFNHVSPTYHSHTHPCQFHLPFTHLPISAPLTSHTLTTYYTRSHMSVPLTTHTTKSAPITTNTLICGLWRRVVRWVCTGLMEESSAFSSMGFINWSYRQFLLRY